MKNKRMPRSHQWMFFLLAFVVAVISVGCQNDGEGTNSAGNINPLAAYQQTTTGTSTGVSVIDGSVTNPGAISQPIITVSDSGTSIDGHSNAPLLDNMHPGWQQPNCFDCHNSTSKNPEHNYTSVTLCKQCHGENGLPGLADVTPPVISGITPSVNTNSIKFTWKTDEECVSSLVLRTFEGDKLTFPASQDYSTSHSVEVSGLQPGTTYYYEIICSDKCKNKTSSSTIYNNASVTTLAAQTTSGGTTPGTGPGSGTGTETDTDTSTETQTFLTNIKCEASGNESVRFDFNVKGDCQAYFYVFPDNVTKVTAETMGTFIRKGDDDFKAGDQFYLLKGLEQDTYYRYWMYVVSNDGNKKYEMSKVSLKRVKTAKL